MANTIYVAGLPDTTSDADLRDLIGQYGAVRSLSVSRDGETGRSRGYAFVEMADDAASSTVTHTLNGTHLAGHALHAELIVSSEMGVAPRGAAGPARVATVQEAEMAWDRLEWWLRKYANPVWYSFYPVALEHEIQLAETRLGLTLPNDMRVVYRHHNGQSALPLFPIGFRFCQLLEVETLWRFQNRIAQQFQDQKYWHPKWVPFADNDAGNCYFAKLNPEDSDCGRIFYWNHGGDLYPIAENFTTLINELAEGLETDRYRMDDTGVVDASSQWI